MRKLLFLSILILFVSLDICTVLEAGVYYVDPVDGSNADSGLTQADAWLTIAYAEQTATNGSTVYLLAGNYGDVTINRATTARQGATPSSWADAVMFLPYESADHRIETLTFGGDKDRYIIWGTDCNFYCPDIVGLSDTIINIPNGNYIKFDGSLIHGTMTKYGDGEYYRDTTTDTAVKCGQSGGVGYSHIIFDGCEIYDVGIFGCNLSPFNNGGCEIINCTLHHIGASFIVPTTKGEATMLIKGNWMHSQLAVNSANAGGAIAYNHGSGIHLCPNLIIENNRFWGLGTSSALRGYQGGASGTGMDGGVTIVGAWDDTAHLFTGGEAVTQEVSGATGMADPDGAFLAGSTSIRICRATDATTFDAVHNIVSDSDPLKIWVPSSITFSSAWGGYHHVTVQNNLFVSCANYMVPELWDIAPPFVMRNNTFAGRAYGAENATHLGAAIWAVAPYYSGSAADFIFTGNIFASNVSQSFPVGGTAVGNIMWRYKSTGGQAQLDADWPPAGSNKCYGSTQDLDQIGMFTTAGQMWVGGTGFDHAFDAVTNDPTTKAYVVSGWTYSDLDHQFDVHAESPAVGFADPANSTTLDAWGIPRDGDPDSGYDEYVPNFKWFLVTK